MNGAVTYLSHSQYGINQGIEINSSSTTGAGNGTTYGAPGTGIYTYPQSTTGNITGVFDMSGGKCEYVMSVLSDSDGMPRSGYGAGYSGFNGMTGNGSVYSSGISFPQRKYYDLYDIDDISLCTLDVCGGHALDETSRWYGDDSYFLSGYWRG